MAQSFGPAPPSGSALLAAAQWVEGVLLGSFGTALAVIAVTWVAFGMLAGRVPARRGLMVLLGCFVLFSAPVLARMLIGLTRGSGEAGAPVTLQKAASPPAPPPAMPPPHDPYAGAAVPGSGD